MSETPIALYRVTVRGVVPSMTLLVICDVPGLVKAQAMQAIGQHIDTHNREVHEEVERKRQHFTDMGYAKPDMLRETILSGLQNPEHYTDLYIQRLCEDVSNGWVGGPYYGID